MGLAATWRYRQFIEAPPPGDFSLPQPSSRPLPLPPEEVLVGEAALNLLKAYDLPLVPGVLAADVAAAAAAAMEMGYPVVLKIISPEWVHKSDWGGVRLNVTTEAELRQAYLDLTARFHQCTPAGTLQGILVQKQVHGVELLMGLKRDPQFGPVLVAGAGGIYTEVLRDVARALVPITPDQGAKMLQSLKIFPILQAIPGAGRGGPPGPDRGPGQPLPAGGGLPGNPGTGPQPRGGRAPGLLVRRLPDSAGGDNLRGGPGDVFVKVPRPPLKLPSQPPVGGRKPGRP